MFCFKSFGLSSTYISQSLKIVTMATTVTLCIIPCTDSITFHICKFCWCIMWIEHTPTLWNSNFFEQISAVHKISFCYAIRRLPAALPLQKSTTRPHFEPIHDIQFISLRMNLIGVSTILPSIISCQSGSSIM